MSSISIIGTGNMARTIGTLAVAGGNTVEVMGRDQSKAANLAEALGGGATSGEWGAVPAGDIVIVAVLYDSVVPIVAEYGDALAGKAHWLEAAGLVEMGLARHGAGHWDIALGVTEFLTP